MSVVIVMMLMVYLFGWKCTQHESWLHTFCSEMLHFVCLPFTFVICWIFSKTFILATQGPCHKTNFNICNYFQWIPYESYYLYIAIPFTFLSPASLYYTQFVACVRVLFYHDVFWWRYSSRLMKFVGRYRCSILHKETWRSTKTSRHTAICFLKNIF